MFVFTFCLLYLFNSFFYSLLKFSYWTLIQHHFLHLSFHHFFWYRILNHFCCFLDVNFIFWVLVFQFFLYIFKHHFWWRYSCSCELSSRFLRLSLFRWCQNKQRRILLSMKIILIRLILQWLFCIKMKSWWSKATKSGWLYFLITCSYQPRHISP